MSKLIGNDVNQVPSNADLGTAAFMDANDFLTAKGSNLSAIKSVVTKSALDVFVYDTAKDSDGGAWRKRTQNTSWYNEPLNTRVRGSRREFPAVAVIVIETDKVTIYDGDDPELPMWMYFDRKDAQPDVSFIGASAGNLKSVKALNGKMAVGMTIYGMFLTDFIKDKCNRYNTSFLELSESVSGRNRPSSLFNLGTGIVDATVNDVAMTVLPGAPIDDATGLPVPTIAAATNGGLSVIRDNGSIVDITAGSGSSYSGVSWVDITKNHNLIFEQDNSSNPRSVFCIPIPSFDRTTQTNDGSIEDKVILKFYDNNAHAPYPAFAGGGVIDAIPMEGDNQALRSGSGNSYAGVGPSLVLTLLEPNLANPEQGKVAYITSDYNTGWILGNAKLASLSDTSTEAINDKDIVTNGSFDNGTTGWTVADSGEGSISASGGQLTLNNTTTANPPVACYQAINLVPGKYYTLSSDQASGHQCVVNIVDTVTAGGGSAGYGNVTYHDTVPSTRDTTFLATSQTNYIVIRVNTNTTGTAVMNSVSIVRAEPDRSVHGRFIRDRASGLSVVGNLRKSKVAAGADLVSYHGFDASSALRQPIATSDSNSMQFGQNDFALMVWVKHDDTGSGTRILFDYCKDNWPANPVRFFFGIDNSDYLYYYTNDASGSSTGNTAKVLGTSRWHHCCFVRQGNQHKIYKNGILETNQYKVVRDITETSAYLTIGNAFGNGNPFDGSLALARVLATAPTSEQIKQIYESEKPLFQENAKATLYGNTDSVRAFAYDDSTRLLHVGTLDGRSVFQGLQRIDNTTNEVSTTMSASNGLVVGR